jgi:phage-related tail fiber protein
MPLFGSGHEIVTSTTRPSTPLEGQVVYETDTNKLVLYNENGWEYTNAAGEVSYFARSTAPIGWLKANGATISRTAYNDLFSAIGTNYGAGDGSTTFTLPDFRGEFLRAWADGRGVDTGRTLHSFQDYDWKGFYQSNTGQNTTAYNHNNVYMGKSIYGSYTGNLFVGYWAAPSAAMGTAWDGSEIRPRNRALLACIKY